MAEFIVPDFIKNKSTKNIHKQMRDNLPPDIDCSEGSDVWNLTYPTAYEHAYFAQFCLLNSIKLIWPQFSYGIYSDYHGEARGMSRREGQYATGYIVVTGAAGTSIPEGSIFSTEQLGDTAPVEFETTGSYTIGEELTVTIPIACVSIGKIGNVPANTIVVNGDKILGISSVTNPESINNGYDAESDEAYNERQKEYDSTQDNSYIGNDNDYRRWALEVSGVGEAVVLDPEDNPAVDDDSGVVTLIIVDSNGNPASTTICADVYNYIMCPSPLSTTGQKTEGQTTGLDRKAPPGVILVVIPPNTSVLTISGTVELDGTTDIEAVKSSYVTVLQEYLLQAIQDGEIRYSRITACLSSVSGVADYKDILLNGGTVNIPLSAQQIPIVSVENITLAAGLVDG